MLIAAIIGLVARDDDEEEPTSVQQETNGTVSSQSLPFPPQK